MNMYKLINTLFWGVDWNHILVFHIDKGVEEGNEIRRELIKKAPHAHKSNADQRTLIGIEDHCDCSGTEKIEAIMEDKDLKNAKGLFFIVRKKKQAIQIARKLRVSSFREIEIYGLDPDYFFSIVPLTGNNKKLEKYILNLKTDFTLNGRIKKLIKKLLISSGLSSALYEFFIITAVNLS